MRSRNGGRGRNDAKSRSRGIWSHSGPDRRAKGTEPTVARARSVRPSPLLGDRFAAASAAPVSDVEVTNVEVLERRGPVAHLAPAHRVADHALAAATDAATPFAVAASRVGNSAKFAASGPAGLPHGERDPAAFSRAGEYSESGWRCAHTLVSAPPPWALVGIPFARPSILARPDSRAREGDVDARSVQPPSGGQSRWRRPVARSARGKGAAGRVRQRNHT